MEKYGVVTKTPETKTASETCHCPECGHVIDKSTPNYCIECGTKPFEPRPPKK
jgi:hypothetical protein